MQNLSRLVGEYKSRMRMRWGEHIFFQYPKHKECGNDQSKHLVFLSLS